MDINIQAIADAKIKEMEEKGVIKATLESGIEKLVTQAITEALNGYALKRDIEEKVEKQVSEVVGQIGFTAYNGFIAEKVKQITENVCHADIAEKIQKAFDEILVIKRDSIKLSEICDTYREWICGEVDEAEKYELENFHVSIEKEPEYGWLDFKFAKEKPKYGGNGENSITFTVHRNRDNKQVGWIGSVWIDGYSIDKTFNFGAMSSIERLLLNIAYNKTPIEIDVESENDIDDSFDVDV